MSVNLFSDLVN